MTALVDWQPSLFDAGPAALDGDFTGLSRIVLDEHSWVDYCPSWLTGSTSVLESLTDAGSDDAPIVAAMAEALSARYAVDFDRVRVRAYRDGADAVAWHGDRSRLVMTSPLVAIVLLGARHRFLLRPRGTSRATHRLEPGHGDLLVMGGESQVLWEHAVPKSTRPVGARMSVTIGHSRPADGEQWLAEPVSG